MPETLKNLLLVMATAGAFEAAGASEGEQSLAEMTKAVISSWGVADLANLWEEAVGSRQA